MQCVCYYSKAAELVVLSESLSNLPADNWGERIQVEITIANGKIIYEKD